MNRKTVAGVVTGAFLVLAGICVFAQVAGLVDLSIFMNGWGTLFLILPAVASMIISGPRPGNIMLLLLGVWLFLDCQGWLGDRSWTLLGGIFLILLGVRALTGWGRWPGERRHRHHRDPLITDDHR